MPREIRSNNSTEQFIYFSSNASSSSAIEEYLSFIARTSVYTRIRQYIIYHKGDLANTLTSKFFDLYPHFELINPSASVINLDFDYGIDNQKNVKGVIAIFPGNQIDFHRLVTISYSDFWNIAVNKIVRKSYPEAMPVFFKQTEMRDSILSLEENLVEDMRIRISEVTMKRKRQVDPSEIRNLETDRLWTEQPVKKVFDLALERNQWFTSIQFQIQQKRKKAKSFRTISKGRLYKYGVINYDYMHKDINEYLISILEAYSAKRLMMFQGRGIRERGDKSSKPIEILYNQNVFEDSHEIRRFADVINNYPHATKAVFHANPYYHSSVADFLEGSSFEIWVLSQRRILIIPQAKASESAFERLISHISFDFREGEISEYSG